MTITQPSNSLLGALAIGPGNFCPCWSSAKNVAFVVTGPVQALSPVTTILYLCFCQLEYKQKNSKINTQKIKKIHLKFLGQNTNIQGDYIYQPQLFFLQLKYIQKSPK